MTRKALTSSSDELSIANLHCPKEDLRRAVQLEFYPEEVLYKDGVQAISLHRPRAAVLEDGAVLLAERVVGIE